ncbi:hypothetical protein AWB67_00280 [Caballeronia terrestris]|uniref:Uncharacterized protein n=1 Tax=Caballeronia terrestris TaxID=1226301 RepID=A0A158F2L1_9BURK|nr:hypothetical protein [Caballeronia terrestris]SAL13945.1 hypothetical protein AWB67_00280 [Caballeronia terrestris]
MPSDNVMQRVSASGGFADGRSDQRSAQLRKAARSPVMRSGPTGRSWLLWAFVLLVNVAGGVFLWLLMPPGSCNAATPCSMLAHMRVWLWEFVGRAPLPGVTTRSLVAPDDFVVAVVLGAIATTLVAAPFIGFLTRGWFARLDEFRNSLQDGALFAYLRRFWSARLLAAIDESPGGGRPVSEQALGAEQTWKDLEARHAGVSGKVFETIYHEQFGLSSFLPPFLLLVVITYAEGAVLAPLRACGTGAAECTQVFFGAGPQLVISAIAGAYMFAVSDAVISIRRRSLNVSDVYWYALRAFLALPIATLFAQAPGVDGMKPVFAFAVAMLPVDVLLKQIRRLAYPPAVAQANPEEQGDQLLMLTGVTTPVVGLFLSEGVYSVEQIAASDPVLLAIRTGLPFRFVIRLGGQAIVRRHLGDRARELIPLGLADAGPIVELVRRADGGQAFDVATQAARVRLMADGDKDIPLELVQTKFRQIAGEEYAKMLSKIGPLKDAGADAPVAATTPAPAPAAA